MKSALENLARNSTAQYASLMSLAILMLFSAATAVVSAGSLLVETDKDTYNVGDRVSISGTATPNARVSIELLDPSNVTKVDSEVQVASDGRYAMEDAYILKVTDEPGTWRVDVCDLSSNETADAIFEVVALGERLETLEGSVETLGTQLASLQNQVQTLEGAVKTLETLVADLSSRLSAAETRLMIAYGGIVASVVSVALSIVAITRYLQKRDIYRRLVGKKESRRIRRR